MCVCACACVCVHACVCVCVHACMYVLIFCFGCVYLAGQWLYFQGYLTGYSWFPEPLLDNAINIWKYWDLEFCSEDFVFTIYYTVKGKKLWWIWWITSNPPKFFHQFSCFCNMRHAQQHEVRFNLFCIRIEVRILIMQYFKRSSSLSNDSLLIYSWWPWIIDSTVHLAIIKQHAISMWHKTYIGFIL